MYTIGIVSCDNKKHSIGNVAIVKDGYTEIRYFADEKSTRSDTASISYYNVDSFLISSIEFARSGAPEREYLFSSFSDSLSYGLVILFDTIPFKIKHVELIALIKAKTGKRHKIISMNYLKKINPYAYDDWIKKAKPDGFDYQIDTYH